jgi:hypothetical protein
MKMQKKQYRILITGSRIWDNEQAIADLLTRVWNKLKDQQFIEPVLVHGTAPGADTMAATAWIALGGTVEPHPADWDRWGRQAGFVRNKEMVDAGADICFAFIQDNSRGATMTATIAEKAGIKTLRVIRSTPGGAQAKGQG